MTDTLVRPLSQYHDRHLYETCLVCGLGPSLSSIPPDAVGRFSLLGVNDIERYFTPTYLVVVDQPNRFKGDRLSYVRKTRARSVFTQLNTIWRFQEQDQRVVHMKLARGGRGPWHTADATGVPYSSDSTFVATALALYMGFHTIGLIGVDFSDPKHSLHGHLNRIRTRYGELKATVPDDRIIVNLSPGSALDVFPKVTWSQFRQLSGRTKFEEIA